MADSPEDPPEDSKPLTPIQRALAMKQAAIAARPKPPRGGRFQREQATGMKSKPWTTRSR